MGSICVTVTIPLVELALMTLPTSTCPEAGSAGKRSDNGGEAELRFRALDHRVVILNGCGILLAQRVLFFHGRGRGRPL